MPDKDIKNFSVLGKSFEDIGNAFTKAKKEGGGFWSNLFPKKESFDWIKNSAGEIVTGANIDAFMPKLDDSGAMDSLNKLKEIQASVDAGTGSWASYFSGLEEGEKWQIDFVQNTDLQKASLDNVKVAQENSRKAALKHNSALKQQTLGAKAANVAMKGLAMVGNMALSMIASWAVGEALKWVDDLIHAEERAAEAAKQYQEEIDEAYREIEEHQDSLKSASKETRDLKKDLNELLPNFEKLSKGVDLNGNRVNLTDDQYQDWIDTCNSLCELIPGLSTGLDNQGNHVIDLAKAYDILNSSAGGAADAMFGVPNKVAIENENNELKKTLDEDYGKAVDDVKAIIKKSEKTGEKKYIDSIKEKFPYASEDMVDLARMMTGDISPYDDKFDGVNMAETYGISVMWNDGVKAQLKNGLYSGQVIESSEWNPGGSKAKQTKIQQALEIAGIPYGFWHNDRYWDNEGGFGSGSTKPIDVTGSTKAGQNQNHKIYLSPEELQERKDVFNEGYNQTIQDEIRKNLDKDVIEGLLLKNWTYYNLPAEYQNAIKHAIINETFLDKADGGYGESLSGEEYIDYIEKIISSANALHTSSAGSLEKLDVLSVKASSGNIAYDRYKKDYLNILEQDFNLKEDDPLLESLFDTDKIKESDKYKFLRNLGVYASFSDEQIVELVREQWLKDALRENAEKLGLEVDDEVINSIVDTYLKTIVDEDTYLSNEELRKEGYGAAELSEVSKALEPVSKIQSEYAKNGRVSADVVKQLSDALDDVAAFETDEAKTAFETALLSSDLSEINFNTMVNESLTELLNKKFSKGLRNASKDEIIAVLDEIGVKNAEDIADEITRFYSDEENRTKEIEGLTFKFETLGETISAVSSKIATLNSAFGELSKNGYITINTINKIQEATELSDSEFEKYRNSLLSAKAGSEEFNETLDELTILMLENSLDLTTATEEEIEAILRENGVLNANEAAHKIVAGAKLKNQIAGKSLSEITKEDIEDLMDEAIQCGYTEDAFRSLVASIILFNNQDLDVADKIKALNDLGLAIDNIKLKDGQYYYTIPAIGLDIETPITSVGTEYIDGEEYLVYRGGVDGQVLQKEKVSKNTSNLDFNYFNPSSSGGGGGSKRELPDAPEYDIKDYSDLYDEQLEDNQKAREEFEKTDEKNQRLFEKAIEEGNVENVDELSDALITNNRELRDELELQLTSENKTLNNEILPLIFGIAPELETEDGWESVTREQIEKVRQRMEGVLFNENEEWKTTAFNYETELANIANSSGEESKAYKDKEAEYKEAERKHNLLVKSLEHDIDKFDSLVSTADSYIEDAESIKDKIVEIEDADIQTLTSEFNAFKDAYSKTNDELQDFLSDEVKEGNIQNAKEYADNIIENQLEYKKWLQAQLARDDLPIAIKNQIASYLREADEIIADAEQSISDSISNAFSEYERHIQRTTDELQKQADTYDILISKQDAMVDGEKSMYDALRNIRETRREISKELRTNMALGEYLDEDTRKLLFNEDDYDVLSKKLKGISADIAEIGAWYENEINNLTEENWYLEESITKEYERRLAMKEKEYEIARAELDLEKKKQELNNVLNEKNIRMLTKDSQTGAYNWTYVHDVEEASKIVGEISDLEGEINEIRTQAMEDSIVGEKEAKADQLKQEQAAIENRIKLINEEAEAMSKVVENITDPLKDFGLVIQELNSLMNWELIKGIENIDDLSHEDDDVNIDKKHDNKPSDNSDNSPSSNEEFKKKLEDEYYNAVIKLNLYLENNGNIMDETAKKLKAEVDLAEERLNRWRSESPSNFARPTFDKGGSAFGKGFLFKDTDYEEMVLDPVQTDYFKKFVENTKGFDIVAQQMAGFTKSPTFPTTKHGTVEHYSFGGDIVLPSVREPEDFMVELKKHLQQNSFRNI